MSTSLLKKVIGGTFLFLALPLFSHAQSLELQASSLYPPTGDSVSLSLTSFDTDINAVEVSWYKDGKLDKKGIGMKNYSFVVGDSGNTIRATLKIKNQLVEQSIKIQPSSIDVLWEVVGGYEPPFYKGKVFPIKGSRVKVVALPQIKNDKGLVPDAALYSYAWRKDGSNFAGQSGYGLNSFTYLSSALDKENTIEVAGTGFSRSLARNILIAPASSEIHFYEYNVSYGPLYNKAVKNNQTFTKRSINLIAEPYFIFTNSLNDPSLQTEWKLNGRATPTDVKNSILLTIADRITNVEVGFSTNNTSQLLQQNARILRLNIANNE